MTTETVPASATPLHDDERGAVLIWVAGALATLLAVAAFAVDLGWVYMNHSRLQAAADAASLAGVVNLPGFLAEADADAARAAAANHFPIDSTTSMTTHATADNKFSVAMNTSVPTFFLKVLGFTTFDIAASATAEYIKPVALGSPDNQFGGPGQNFWAAINGRYTEIQQGDPYASLCINHSDQEEQCSGSTNPLFRPGGYYYAIEVAPGSSNLAVQIYDGGHYMDDDCDDDWYCRGSSDPSDTSWRWGGWDDDQRGVNLQLNLYEPDQTPLDPTDNDDLRCSRTFPTIEDDNPNSAERNAGHYNQWTGNNNCSVGGSLTPGIWVLQLPSPLYEGSSKFAIRATVSGATQPRVYGLLDMSIHVNFTNGVAEPYLAEVRPEHADRTLEVDIFDLGEFNGSGTIRFINADGGTPDCSWTSSNGDSGSFGACTIDISNQQFNEEWLYVKIKIPDTYSCDPTAMLDCWWKIHINVPNSQPTDRTTWSARITGDPVRLTK